MPTIFQNSAIAACPCFEKLERGSPVLVVVYSKFTYIRGHINMINNSELHYIHKIHYIHTLRYRDHPLEFKFNSIPKKDYGL